MRVWTRAASASSEACVEASWAWRAVDSDSEAERRVRRLGRRAGGAGGARREGGFVREE